MKIELQPLDRQYIELPDDRTCPPFFDGKKAICGRVCLFALGLFCGALSQYYKPYPFSPMSAVLLSGSFLFIDKPKQVKKISLIALVLFLSIATGILTGVGTSMFSKAKLGYFEAVAISAFTHLLNTTPGLFGTVINLGYCTN